MIDVTSAFQGLSTSLPDLYSQISKLGWSVKKVKYDKKVEAFVAIAQNTHGEEIEKTGDRDSTALANLLVAVTRKNHMRTAAQRRVSMWGYSFIDQLKAIAEAYVKAPVYEPKAAISFKELADDCTHRAKVLEKHLEIQIVNNPEPYTDADKMSEDIRKRRKLIVSSANVEHPIWTPEQVIAFRICFDVLGYAVAGAGWDWRGDNLAFSAFAPIISANAQLALFTEVVAQSAYVNQFRAYGPQKVAIFKQFVEPAQREEGLNPKSPGTHPSQSYPPVGAPEAQPFKHDEDIPLLPHHAPIGLRPFSAIDPSYADPNVGWESNVEPQEPNAYLDYGDPLDYQQSMDTAKLLDTEWAQLKTGDNQPDYERMKLAVVNAFRAALLSPRKKLVSNAIHYQDISHIPSGETNPATYWYALDKAREKWNVERFGEDQRYSHRPYWRFVQPMEDIVYKLDPTQGREEARTQTHRMIQAWLTEEQDDLRREDSDLPEEKQASTDEIERKAFKLLEMRMKNYIKESKADMDVREAATDPAEGLEGDELELVRDPLQTRYQAFMGTHLKAIAMVSKHADDLLKAALEDVHDHDGAGHHFRATTLQLGIRGVGAKVCSFAWLLLQPMTSELATIDTHMMALLGKGEKDMNNRDYFRMERELKAGRDAAGYGHMPLGAFQWAMWDNRRTGEGTHQDHSALRPLDPKPYEEIDWREVANPSAKEHLAPPIPDWWENTKPVRDQVGEEWEESKAGQTAKTRIPWTRLNPVVASLKVAEPIRGPKEQFVIEWEKREPIGMDEAKILGEYAAGVNMTRSEVEDYLDDHQSDVHVKFPSNFEDFEERFFKWYDKFHQSSWKVAEVVRSPWFKHPQTGEHMVGLPGETIMSHATKTLGMTTPEVWASLAEAGKA